MYAPNLISDDTRGDSRPQSIVGVPSKSWYDNGPPSSGHRRSSSPAARDHQQCWQRHWRHLHQTESEASDIYKRNGPSTHTARNQPGLRNRAVSKIIPHRNSMQDKLVLIYMFLSNKTKHRYTDRLDPVPLICDLKPTGVRS